MDAEDAPGPGGGSVVGRDRAPLPLLIVDAVDYVPFDPEAGSLF